MRSGVAAAIAVGWQAVRSDDAAPHWLLLKLQEIADAQTTAAFPVGTTSTVVVPWNGGLAAEFRRLGGYEPATTAISLALLRPGMVAIDVGANAGYFTVLFAELVEKQGVVLSFEPCSSVFGTLERNVHRNGLTQVRTLRAAVSNSSGQLPLYYATSEEMHSLARTRLTTDLTESVEASTLDAYVERFKLPRVDLVKIDVEGGELHVLQGANATLTTHRPYVIVEASESSASFGYRPEALSELLQQHRYRVLAIDQPNPLGWSGDLEGAIYVNLLGVPTERADTIPTLLAIIKGAQQRMAEASRRSA
jgi:FkbM family methyltransferase